MKKNEVTFDPMAAEALAARAERALNEGNFAQALAELNQAIQFCPAHADLYFLRGQAYQAMGKWAPALENYQAAIERNPQCPRYYYNGGCVLYFQQQWQESWTYLKKFLSLEPEVPGPARSAHFFCARCGIALGRLPEALAHIDASLRLAASADKQVRSEMYLTRGSILAGLEKQEESLRDLQQALALTVLPLQQAEIHYLMGYVGEEQKRYRFALAEYNQALALDPAHWRAYFNRGMLRRDYQEDVPGALADLEQAARLQPDVAVVYYNRAGLYARLKKNAQALADYTRAIDLDPHNGAYYYGRARVYWMLGQWTQAEQDVRRAHEYGHPTGQTRIDPVRQNGPKDNATPR